MVDSLQRVLSTYMGGGVFPTRETLLSLFWYLGLSWFHFSTFETPKAPHLHPLTPKKTNLQSCQLNPKPQQL